VLSRVYRSLVVLKSAFLLGRRQWVNMSYISPSPGYLYVNFGSRLLGTQ